MPENEITILCKEAEVSEKKYDWLDAVKAYKKALELSLEKESFSEVAEIYNRIGYAYFRAGLQGKTNEHFKNRMQLSSEAYKHALEILQSKGDQEAKGYHSSAMVAYTRSWFEPDFLKMETLLEEWWRLENKALAVYEKAQDPLAIGRTCNNLMEYSVDRRVFFNSKEYLKRVKELSNIGEKAIAVLEKNENKYELARAYCWTAWYYGKKTAGARLPEEDREKSRIYSNKALSVSQDVGDGWLIGWSYNTMSDATLHRAEDFATWLFQALNVLKQGKIIKDNYMMATGKWKAGWVINFAIEFEEDPEKKRQESKKAVQWNREAIFQAKLINAPILTLLAHLVYCKNLISLASLEANLREKRSLLEEAITVGRDGLQLTKDKNWTHGVFPLVALSAALLWLSKVETTNQGKKRYLEEALKMRQYARNTFAAYSDIDDPQTVPSHEFVEGAYQIALIESEIAKLECDKDRKIELYNQAVLSWEKCLQLAEKLAAVVTGPPAGRSEGLYYYDFGDVLSNIFSLTNEQSTVTRTIEAYNKAIDFFSRFNLQLHAAESYWKLASIYSQLGDHLEASNNYNKATEAYNETVKNNPQLRSLCQDQSRYMQAWSQIEQAKYAHSIENYNKAKNDYENAAKLHESMDSWSYLASNYFAWANMEEAEDQSRNENTQQAKALFEKALEQFTIAENAIKKKIGEITSAEEQGMTQRLLQSSVLRRNFCQVRIQIEDAKLLDREGKYLQSSQSYGEAAQNIGSFIEKVESEAERKELEYLAILCRAWEKMAIAEETSSLESYLEAASLFEKARGSCYTKKASLWALGNSSFCKGLAAGLRYKSNMDLKENALAKQYFKDAASSYFTAGFKSASEYAMATLRLFDAYVFMNQAESEVDPEKKTKQYQMADNLLQIAADSFMKAKQPEKTAQVHQITRTVREEKALAVSLNEVLHAPTITSSTTSFTAPSPTSEVSVGLEQFQHANVQASLITEFKEVRVGESFCLSVEFVNAGKEPALLIRVEDFVPSDFIVVKKPEIYRLEESCLNMKGKQIAPLKLVEAKLVLQPSKKGVYQLKPTVHYLDELGQNKKLQLKSVEIKVEEVILADRVTTGTKELDSLLLGGIPEEYSVVLTGSPSDERELIIKNFLEAGIKEAQTSFYVTTEAVGIGNLLEKPGFYLFLCNPKPKIEVLDLPNVTKLRSKTDINNLNMALVRESRNLQQKQGIKRFCVELVSDVLLRQGPEVTRRWLSELITDLGSKGFTILAVLDPSMHPADQANAIINLFDGEISLYQSGDPLECKKSLLIKKLRGQDYIKNPICLTK